MSSQIYDEAHVAISRLIGRRYNNPLGESAFPLLRRLVGEGGEPISVLDVGCGRGRTALWWARHGARVVAFDPSAAMLQEARMLVDEAGLSNSVSFTCTDISGFRATGEFDLVIVHDVLCYSDDRGRDLARLVSCCRPRGILSSSDYIGDGEDATVGAIVSAWGIRGPLSFEQYRSVLDDLSLDVLLMSDTTRQYAHHWREIRKRIDSRRPRLLQEVGSDAVERLESQIDAIETAVGSGRFGHLWALLEKRGEDDRDD